MATREFKSDQNKVALLSPSTIFTVPSGETWLVQRLSRRVVAAASPTDVEVRRKVSGTSEQEVLEDLGDSPALESEDVNITNMQGKVLEAGDEIIGSRNTGTITMNFHIDYLRIVP